MHRSASTSHRFARPRRIGIAALAAALITTASLLAPEQLAGAASAPDQWTGIGGDGRNTSTNPGEHVLTSANAAKARRAWLQGDTSAWPYPPVVLAGVAYGTSTISSGNGAYPVFVAYSVRTGAVQWRLRLPADGHYGYGMTGAGRIVLVAVRSEPGGVVAIDTTARKVLWRSSFPPATIPGDSDDYPGLPITDGSRVYVAGSSNGVNVYSLTTGAKLWSKPRTFRSNGTLNPFSTIAAAGGIAYATTERGLTAFDAASGRVLWAGSTIDASGQPEVAGGRVFVATQHGVAAYPASGCGRTTCTPIWTRSLVTDQTRELSIDSADGSSVFVVSTTTPTTTTECDMRTTGGVTRLSASTGATQWSVRTGDFVTGLIRAGDMIWLLNEFRSTANGCAEQDRILGYSAKATGAAPLASIALPSDRWGFPQSLAVASGTLFQSAVSGIAGYRVPGT